MLNGHSNIEHALALIGVSKRFTTQDGPTTAVDDISFDLRGSEFFTMLGPSGCGKTTTLRMIAGLETPTSGRILFDGQDLARGSALGRNIGMVFQSYALFPHMNLFENVAYGLRVRALPAAETRQRVERMLSLLGLTHLAARYPADLSGGQQQRVAIARALVYEPGMLLLDEPLANLDAKLRVEMREEIRRLQKQLGILTIYVTHDQEEAMSVSDRIAVFDRGRLRQIGNPADIYANPATLFVADFVGKANFLPVQISRHDHTGAVVQVGAVERLVSRVRALPPDELSSIPDGHGGLVMVRPEHTVLIPGDGALSCHVRRAQFLGSFVRYTVTRPDGSEVLVETPRPITGIVEGASATFDFEGSDAILFTRDAKA